jgi:hypothetical protein
MCRSLKDATGDPPNQRDGHDGQSDVGYFVHRRAAIGDCGTNRVQIFDERRETRNLYGNTVASTADACFKP